MSSMAHGSTVLQIWVRKPRGTTATTGFGVKLLPSGDGWSLVAPDGELLFQGLGTHARRDCLECARDHGVDAVLSSLGS
jgi:hypothetical protein